jgi:hypothetical protein
LSLVGLAFLVLFLFPRFGQAQQRPDPNAMFERLDQNGDGVLTLEEVPEQRQRFFDRMMQRADQNQDGKLTQEEFTTSLNTGPGGRRMRGRRPGRAPGGPLQESGSLVGQPLPDIAVYDAEGKEFSLSSLKGDYSVLVFGCLT